MMTSPESSVSSFAIPSAVLRGGRSSVVVAVVVVRVVVVDEMQLGCVGRSSLCESKVYHIRVLVNLGQVEVLRHHVRPVFGAWDTVQGRILRTCCSRIHRAAESVYRALRTFLLFINLQPRLGLEHDPLDETLKSQ